MLAEEEKGEVENTINIGTESDDPRSPTHRTEHSYIAQLSSFDLITHPHASIVFKSAAGTATIAGVKRLSAGAI